jgi:hypothetical protein
MKKINILCLFILFSSCSKEDEILNKNSFNYGDYTALSMVSNIPIDANFDGNYSTDFLNEFLSYSITARSTFKFYSSDNNKSGLNIILQTMQRWPLAYQDDKTNITNRGVWATINNVGINIVSAPFAVDGDGNPTATKLIDFEIIDKTTIKLKFNHNLIYDIPTASWKTIIVEGIYKKNE